MSSPSHVAIRAAVVDGILAFLAGQDFLTLAEIRAALEEELDAAGPEALVTLKMRLAATLDWNYYACDPLARRIHHRLAERFLASDSEVHGLEHLAIGPATPTVLVSNHLSYADANVIEVLLARSGQHVLADRLTVVAGPKVFSSRERRFSSLCFATIRVPQSVDVSSQDAVMSARDVARAARRAIECAHARLAAGDALLIFPEGTRSRTGAMTPLLPAVARYLEVAGAVVLPVALTGPDRMFPVNDPVLRPAPVIMRIGAPLDASQLFANAQNDRERVMNVIGRAIATLLPAGYRGIYSADQS